MDIIIRENGGWRFEILWLLNNVTLKSGQQKQNKMAAMVAILDFWLK